MNQYKEFNVLACQLLAEALLDTLNSQMDAVRSKISDKTSRVRKMIPDAVKGSSARVVGLITSKKEKKPKVNKPLLPLEARVKYDYVSLINFELLSETFRKLEVDPSGVNLYIELENLPQKLKKEFTGKVKEDMSFLKNKKYEVDLKLTFAENFYKTLFFKCLQLEDKQKKEVIFQIFRIYLLTKFDQFLFESNDSESISDIFFRRHCDVEKPKKINLNIDYNKVFTVLEKDMSNKQKHENSVLLEECKVSGDILTELKHYSIHQSPDASKEILSLKDRINSIRGLQTLYIASTFYINKHDHLMLDFILRNIKTLKQQEVTGAIRQKAFNQLTTEVNKLSNANEKIKLLSENRNLGVFTQHRSNHFFTGAFGRTCTAKKIDLMIENIQMGRSTTFGVR